MTKVSTCLIGGKDDVRRSLGAALAEKSFAVVGDFDGHDACAEASDRMAEPELILFLANDTTSRPDCGIEALSTVYPDTHLVVLGDDPDRQRLGSCIAAGASAYLPWTISPAALVQSLRLILLGEKMYIAGSKPSQAPTQPSDRRRAPRSKTLKRAQIVYQGGHCVIDGTIMDMSQGGAKIRPADLLNMPRQFELRVQYGPTRRCEVVRRSGFYLGVRFADDTKTAGAVAG